MNFEEHKLAVVGKAMCRDDGCCERNAAERFNGIYVELSVGTTLINRNLLVENRLVVRT